MALASIALHRNFRANLINSKSSICDTARRTALKNWHSPPICRNATSKGKINRRGFQALPHEISSDLNETLLRADAITYRSADARPCVWKGERVSKTFRKRDSCCRLYLAGGGIDCSTCVVKASRDRELQFAIRRNLGVDQTITPFDDR